MVNALRRAHRMLAPQGCVVDVHPTDTVASVQLGARTIGPLEGGDAPVRHAAATTALSTAISEGLFTVTRTVDFEFYTYGDTIGELRDYVAETYKDARITGETVLRAQQELLTTPGGVRPRVREHVRLTTLCPI
jgi:hypothetical protein